MSMKNEELQRAVALMPSDLAAAHKIAQLHEGDPLADTIHAIIHRREGDFDNSLYWWRRVGDRIAPEVKAVYPGEDPAAFVRTAKTGGAPDVVSSVDRAEIDALKAALAQ